MMWDFPCRTVFFSHSFMGWFQMVTTWHPHWDPHLKMVLGRWKKKQKWDGFIQFSSAKEKYQNWWCLTFFAVTVVPRFCHVIPQVFTMAKTQGWSPSDMTYSLESLELINCLQILCQMLFDKIHMKQLRQTTSWYSSHVLLTCRSQEIWQNPLFYP